MTDTPQHPRILLTGATGYVGSRLLRALGDRGEAVRCLVRHDIPEDERVGEAEYVLGDVLSHHSLVAAMSGIEVAYYLIHSMGSGRDFVERDRTAARSFAAAAAEAGVKKVVYLGGLGSGDDLSEHLASRQEVGRILRGGAVPAVEFRASIIIGAGSLSFEMIQSLVRRLPVMITPTWVRVSAQPIHIDDVIAYLVAALEYEGTQSEVFEIGGADVASYGMIMMTYADVAGLKRVMVPVPVLTPGLSSLWLDLVTPVQADVGRVLIESIRNETVVKDPKALDVFDIQPRGLKQAIAQALEESQQQKIAERTSSKSAGKLDPIPIHPRWATQRVSDVRSAHVDATAEQAFLPIREIGGRRGWYYANWLWQIRGFIDGILGGSGLRKGRKHPTLLKPGDPLDCWRVEKVDPPHLLQLHAEMKLPGDAWLIFEVNDEAGGARVTQRAVFDPAGKVGLAYWYGLHPVHTLVFAGMLKGIVATIKAGQGRSVADSAFQKDSC